MSKCPACIASRDNGKEYCKIHAPRMILGGISASDVHTLGDSGKETVTPLSDIEAWSTPPKGGSSVKRPEQPRLVDDLTIKVGVDTSELDAAIEKATTLANELERAAKAMERLDKPQTRRTL